MAFNNLTVKDLPIRDTLSKKKIEEREIKQDNRIRDTNSSSN